MARPNKSPLLKRGWPADNVERRPIADLEPYALNARTHSDEQVAQIAASMREWGWTNPVLIDPDGGIIAGHGRILAARQIGIKDVPCMVAYDWTEAQKRAYVIADNKLALNSGWDDFALLDEIQGLAGMDFDLELTGFSGDELDSLLTQEPALRERTEKIEPISWTRILISIPNMAGEPEKLTEALDQVKALGGQVDYAGTNEKD